ncbi:MAG TPA: DHA2 family efflux MFS transporter permease subunit [Planctomycetota bacterium]|nr:DHA2 family efflux MFS transporter permease subunit [Planctomycetota bacterium]
MVAEHQRSPWLVAITVTLATFMEVLDTSIANVALPHIAGSLSAGIDESTWVLTSYLVANAIVLPISGWIASIVGRKRFYMTCVALFTASSFACGLAPNLPALIVFRILQGLGGGGLQPSEQSILADTFAPEKRGMAFAFYGFAVVAAPVIGPTLGGWITDNYTWRWIFYINVPVGILSIAMTHMIVQDPPHLAIERERRRREGWGVDWVGLSLIALGLGALQIMLDKGNREDWFASDLIRITGGLALAGIVGAIVWEAHHRHPIVDLSLFRERNFAASFVLMFVLGFVLLGSTVLIPQFTQALLGYTATLAGLVISPGGLAVMALMPVVGFLSGRVQARWLILFGLVSTALALVHMSTWSLDVDFRKLALARVFQASGIAFLFVPINTASYAFAPRDKTNAVSGLINLARNVGASVGIALLTTFLARRQQLHQSDIVSHLTPYDPIYRQTLSATGRALAQHGLSPAVAARANVGAIYATVGQQAGMLAFADCFRVMALCFVAAIALTFLLKGAKASGAAMAH